MEAARDILRRGFDLKRAGARQKALRGEDVPEAPGIFLTTDLNRARWYAGDDLSAPGLHKGGAVIEARVNGRLMSSDEWWSLLATVKNDLGDTAMWPSYSDRMASYEEAIRRAQKQGFSGFEEHQGEYLVFNPRAIKVEGILDADSGSPLRMASRVAARWLSSPLRLQRDYGAPEEEEEGQSKVAVRKLFWHGTATKNLRGILKQGLIPTGTKKVFEDDLGQAGQRSIKTFGGIYLSDQWMTAYSASSTAARAAKGVASGRVETQLMIGATLETRSPKALADEDDVVPWADQINGRTYDDLRSYRSIWAPLWPYDSRTSWEGAFDPKKLDKVADTLLTADLSQGVEKFMGLVIEQWPASERGYKARKPLVDKAVDRLLRAHAAHLIENEIVSNRDRRIKRVTELLEKVPTVSWYETDEERTEAVQRYKEELRAIQNPPAVFVNTWPELAAATEEVSKLIPEMTGEKKWSMRHNIRFMEPITYSGKNRILMVVEIQEPEAKDDWRYTDIIFHYGPQHYKEFLKGYEGSVGQTYRVLDRNGRVLDWSLNPRDEWPEHLWGPSPRAVAARWVESRKKPLDEKRRERNEATNERLWEKILELARGDRRDMRYRGKVIQGPNDGRGFEEYPSRFANGWAVNIYNMLGGKWKRLADDSEAE